MKVVIIGASTAGLYCAYLLAREGIDVEVFERNHEVGPPPRTLIVTQKLNQLLFDLPEETILNRIKYIDVFSRSRSARLELSEPDLVVEREKLITLFGRQAEKAGAKVTLGHEFLSHERANGKIRIHLKHLTTGERLHASADVLVGADGFRSVVGSSASLSRKNNGDGRRGDDGRADYNGHNLKALFQARVPLPADIPCDATQTWFDSDRTNYFIWLIPESETMAAVGTIAETARAAAACVLKFMEEKNLEPCEFQSALVPLHRFTANGNGHCPSWNVFLVGDAAAQVKATTAGGLVTGLRGGMALCRALLSGRHYQRELRGLKRELNLHLAARFILDRFTNDDYDALISMLNGRMKGVLGRWTRDDLTSGVWHLLRAEPRLLLLGTKAAFRSLL